jgi:putative hemolysin
VQILDMASGVLLRVVGAGDNTSPRITEEEVRAAIHEGAEAGVLKQLEKEMLSGVMRLADRRAELIMTAREDLATVNLDATTDEIWREISASRHTRLIAERGQPPRVVGVLQAKDLLGLRLEDSTSAFEGILFQPPRVGLDLPATEVLQRLRAASTHLLLVVDDEDEVAGIVTVADVLKAIIGDMGDAGPETPTMRERDASSWLIDGSMLIDIVSDRLGLVSLPARRSFDSLAGFLLWQFERLPEEGERIHFDGHVFEVIDMDGPRIDKVLVTRQPDGIGLDNELAGG